MALAAWCFCHVGMIVILVPGRSCLNIPAFNQILDAFNIVIAGIRIAAGRGDAVRDRLVRAMQNALHLIVTQG